MARGITHGLFALLTGSIALLFLGGEPLIVLGMAILGGFLPDIDEPSSTLGRKFKIIGWLSRHRGFFHSLVAAVMFTILAEYLFRALGIFRSPYPAHLLIGYLSHLLLDAATHDGIHPFYPAAIHWKGHAKTGSFVEYALALLMAVVLVVYWL